MTRRILVALITLIIAVVAGAMLPLAMNAASHDKTSFTNETADEAKTYAAIWQSPLSGGANAAVIQLFDHPVNGLIVIPYADGIVKAGKNTAYGTPTAAEITQAGVAKVRYSKGTPYVVTTSSAVTVAVAVDHNGESPGPVVGVVLVSESTAPLNSEIRTLWTILIAVGAAGLLGAALLAVWLARWVSRPLAGLDTVARQLADGDLTVRAEPDYGPPEVRRLARTFNTTLRSTVL